MPPTKQLAREVFLRTLNSIDIPAAMAQKIEFAGNRVALPGGAFELPDGAQFRIVAIGKAAHAMTAGLVALAPKGTEFRGMVTAPTVPAKPLPGVDYFVGGHPIPNRDSWRSAEAMLRFLSTCDARTVVFFLLSGGGSALVEQPLDPRMTLEDVQQVNQALVTCGASIDAINTVRRHLSAIKGGRLALAAGPANKITLAVTDVPAGQESSLASGPTLADPTTVADVERIFVEYRLKPRFPESLRQWLDAGRMPETPKPGHPAFVNARFSLLLGMEELFHAAHHTLEAHGYLCCCDNSTDDWPVEKAANYLLEQLESWQRENPGEPVAIVADGEVASPVTGSGTGGRNSAFVLSCVERIAGRNTVVLSAGTDGVDGNSPAAGAVADGNTLARAQSVGLDPAAAFRQSDAYSFFARLDDVIVTGPTGNNLRDLRILMTAP
jgi:hydroxypyruvate reductase